MGISRHDFMIIRNHREEETAPFKTYPTGSGNDRAIWIKPTLVCTVKYMTKTARGGLRQAVYKGLRDDKTAKECIETQ